MSDENIELVDIWKIYKTLGPWALPALNIQMSPEESEETVWLLYELELFNNKLRRQYTSDDGKSSVRLLWDMT